MTNQTQPYKGDPALTQANYGGTPYIGPERVEHYHEQEPAAQRSTSRRVLQIVAIVVLLALAVVNVIRAVAGIVLVASMQANPDPAVSTTPAVVGVVGSFVLAALFLAYPLVVLVRSRPSPLR